MDLGERKSFSARIRAAQRVEIRPQVAGIIQQKHFIDGDFVARGTPLFQIDTRSPEAALAESRASLARTKAQLEDAEQSASRSRVLFEKSTISRAEFERAQANAKAARASVALAQAGVKQSKLNRGFATIIAPFDGLVGQSAVDVGSYVSPGEQNLAVLNQVDPISVDFQLSEREFLSLKTGAKRTLDELHVNLGVALELADGRIYRYQGRLIPIAVELDRETGTLPVRAVFPNPDGQLLPGLFARVHVVQRSQQPRLLVPREAIVHKQVGPVVFVVNASGRVEERRVELGQYVGDLQIVHTGLDSQERVVKHGVHKCREGIEVKAKELDADTLGSDPLDPLPEDLEGDWLEAFLAQSRVATLH